MHAHDARRYVGDMLAWVHQALANERELLVGLFGDAQQQSSDQTGMVQHGQQHGQNDGGDGTHGGVSESEMVGVADVLDQVFESVCKPLEVRIDSVLNSVPPPLTCYKLSQVWLLWRWGCCGGVVAGGVWVLWRYGWSGGVIVKRV